MLFRVLPTSEARHVGDEFTLPIVEPVEIGRLARTGKVLARHADERPREVGQARSRGFIRQDAGVEDLR